MTESNATFPPEPSTPHRSALVRAPVVPLLLATAILLASCGSGEPHTSEVGGELALSRTTVRLVGEAGDPGPGPEEIRVSELDGPVGDLEVLIVYPNGQPTEWVDASLSAPRAPATLTVAVDPTELARGAYRAAVLVRGEAARNGDQVLLVDMDLTCPEVSPGRVAVCGSFVDAAELVPEDDEEAVSPPGRGARPAGGRGS